MIIIIEETHSKTVFAYFDKNTNIKIINMDTVKDTLLFICVYLKENIVVY